MSLEDSRKTWLTPKRWLKMQLKKRESDSKLKKKRHGKTKSKETILRVLQSFCFLNVIITVMVVVTGL